MQERAISRPERGAARTRPWLRSGAAALLAVVLGLGACDTGDDTAASDFCRQVEQMEEGVFRVPAATTVNEGELAATRDQLARLEAAAPDDIGPAIADLREALVDMSDGLAAAREQPTELGEGLSGVQQAADRAEEAGSEVAQLVEEECGA